jgi:hypothetical protein
MVLNPDVFLKGIDPELNNYGISSAIGLWLHLDEQGFMDPGLEMYDRRAVRDLFSAAPAPDQGRGAAERRQH